MEHAQSVANDALSISLNDENMKKFVDMYPDFLKITIASAWLHDVRDHKYPDSISREELWQYINNLFDGDDETTNNIMELCRICKMARKKASIRNAVIKSIISEYQHLLRIILIEVPARPIKINHGAMTFNIMEQRLISYGITCSERQ